jgi:hypothetical protein
MSNLFGGDTALVRRRQAVSLTPVDLHEELTCKALPEVSFSLVDDLSEPEEHISHFRAAIAVVLPYSL